VEDELPFTLMDESGHEIVSDKLIFSQDTIKVVIPVVMIKDIPLVVNLTPGAGADAANSACTVNPPTISVSGDAETLGNLNQIVLGTIDLSQFLTSKTQEFQIVLPNGTTNLTGITTASVSVDITGLDSVHLSADNIQVTNVTAGYTATIVTKSLDIILRGKTDELKTIGPSNIRIIADLTELGETTGTYSVIAKVYVDGDVTTVGPIGEYKVTVTLNKEK
jgi:hypothetical protein